MLEFSWNSNKLVGNFVSISTQFKLFQLLTPIQLQKSIWEKFMGCCSNFFTIFVNAHLILKWGYVARFEIIGIVISGVRYVPGGVKSGFKHYDPQSAPPRLFKVKGKRNVRVVEVILIFKSISLTFNFTGFDSGPN